MECRWWPLKSRLIFADSAYQITSYNFWAEMWEPGECCLFKFRQAKHVMHAVDFAFKRMRPRSWPFSEYILTCTQSKSVSSLFKTYNAEKSISPFYQGFLKWKFIWLLKKEPTFLPHRTWYFKENSLSLPRHGSSFAQTLLRYARLYSISILTSINIFTTADTKVP